ncbi:MAG: hypothetical protein A4S09_11450 [Proteobacteria bacterium SG_bin7]|nr:MAG: hypothetical protein A4S09_11450 [Proteobacteria bacterium SG_bin7]
MLQSELQREWEFSDGYYATPRRNLLDLIDRIYGKSHEVLLNDFKFDPSLVSRFIKERNVKKRENPYDCGTTEESFVKFQKFINDRIIHLEGLVRQYLKVARLPPGKNRS